MVAILGAGESGVGAAMLAKQLGEEIWVSDRGSIPLAIKAELARMEVPYEENGHSEEKILSATLVIKSPGIPDSAPIVAKIKEQGIEIIGEIEYAFRHKPRYSRIVGITGSNGKTTTTTLVAHVLDNAGLPTRMGGNVGKSFARLIAEDRKKKNNRMVYVLELSSFQLDDIVEFRPNIGILLNITPDHLDRYEYRMDLYVASKFRITLNQLSADFLIYNAMDPEIAKYLAANEGKISAKLRPIEGDYMKGNKIRALRKDFDLSTTKLVGPHNWFNATCAAWAAILEGADAEDIQQALNTYTPPPHRMERVANRNGVLWINDSKATNVDSVYHALRSVDNPTIWIVGGTDKGNDYTPLMDLVEKKVKAIICLGADNRKLHETFGALGKPMTDVRSADEAVRAALKQAENGNTVLLSPACASFDLFQNYEDRGDQFRAAVLRQANTIRG